MSLPRLYPGFAPDEILTIPSYEDWTVEELLQ